MTFEFKPSFDRSVRSLDAKKKEEVKELCLAWLIFFQGLGIFQPDLALKT